MVSGLRVERRHDVEAFQALRNDWNHLVAQSERPTVFLSWEWLYAWWTHFGNGMTLHLHVVRDSRGAVVGIGPFCIERVTGVWPARILRFLGTKVVGSDYLDILAAPGLEGEVSAAILQGLRESRAAWDIAELSDVLDSSLTLRFLSEGARASRYSLAVAVGEWCPYLPLAETLEEYFVSIGRSKRSRLKRAKKAVEAIGCTYVTAESQEALAPTLDVMFDLHERRWAARGLTGNMSHPSVRAFHHTLARLLGPGDRMRIYTLVREGKALACDYVLHWGTTAYFYQTAYDTDPALEQYHPGYTLLANCIEDCVARGAREFDFLRGREGYKERWTSTARETRKLTLVRNEHGAAMARFRGEQALVWAKRKAKGLLSLGKRACVA